MRFGRSWASGGPDPPYLWSSKGEAGLTRLPTIHSHRRRFLIIASAALCASACSPGEGVTVEHPEFNPPLGVSGIGAAYFTIRSAVADRIIAVTSPEAEAVEIHASVTKGDRVTMQHIETLDLPAGETIRFAPGSYHLMVFSPRTSAAETTFPITIELQSGVKKTVAFKKVTGGSERR